jgi:hypothetical protein
VNKVKQPEERLEKLILVSFYSRGQRVWGLLPAFKVGNDYKVAPSNLDVLIRRLNIPEGVQASVSY